ncbi:MAG: PhoH family protein [Alphaproteobacteria bacterium]|nr:PhoH family protein [Alphaproteobacteria bacterium]MDE1930466.1 PhoH family protein [Alphaproteobacteria bacterium]
MSPRDTARDAEARFNLHFADNALLPQLFGEHDKHLERIERALGVALVSRGNRLAISGSEAAADIARAALAALYERLKRGDEVDAHAVDAALRMAQHRGANRGEPGGDGEEIRTRKRRITPRGPAQAAYIKALRTHELVFGLGPAGTGKTYLAVAMAVDLLMAGKVDRIVLSRPAVEAGERLGFLPGDLREKVDPYLRPLYDALHDMLPGEQVMKRLSLGDIEIAPLAFMRGRTLANAFVILDEAQNTTPVQMKMFLTRLGENARMAVTGDLSQIDLPKGTRSGLTDAVETLAGVDGIAMIHFTEADVVRHPLVSRIVAAYDRHDQRAKRTKSDDRGE